MRKVTRTQLLCSVFGALLLQLSACRTGSDGDPWAHLYTEDDTTDDDTSDDDADDDAPPGRVIGAPSLRDDDDSAGDDVGSDDTSALPTDDDAVDPSDDSADDVAVPNDDTPDDDTSLSSPDDDLADDDTSGTDDDVSEDDTSPADDDVTLPDDDISDDDTSLTDDDTPIGPTDDDLADDDIPEPECVSSLEFCDSIDNDCDGLTDEGFVCPPEPGVVGAVPFEGGVYFEGTTLPGSAAATALQRFWPSLEEGYIDGFDSYDDNFRIRRSDHQLFFNNRDELIASVDGVVPITPCESAPFSHDFDAENVLFYHCSAGLFRDGEELTAESAQLFGVTDDGRAVGRIADVGPGHWTGSEFVPAPLDLGFSTIQYMTATVQGNVVVVPMLVQDREIVVLKFDEQSQWSVMRRQAVVAEELGARITAIVDGTVFMAQWDPNSSGEFRILGYLPDGSEAVVWHESEANTVLDPNGFLTGPLDPAQILR